MGLWSKLKEIQEEGRAELAQMAHYGVHSVKGGIYNYLPEGRIKSVMRPVAGATAAFESGADKSRPTLTRIGAGAIVAGPVGAVLGGMFKKDTSKCYVTVIFDDGDTVIIEGPASDEAKMRKFAADVNRIAAS